MEKIIVSSESRRQAAEHLRDLAKGASKVAVSDEQIRTTLCRLGNEVFNSGKCQEIAATLFNLAAEYESPKDRVEAVCSFLESVDEA